MSYIPQFDAHESTHTKLQESRHIPTLTCLASITRLPTFEEAASGFPNKRTLGYLINEQPRLLIFKILPPCSPKIPPARLLIFLNNISDKTDHQNVFYP